MSRRIVRAGLVTALLMAALAMADFPAMALHASPPSPTPAQESEFQGTTSVVVVEVPVNVIHEGEPLRGLTAQNFEVYDEGDLRPLIGFDVVDLSDPERASPARERVHTPIAARRHFLLLFDFSFSTTDAIARSLAASRELIDRGLHAADLVGVAIHGGAIGTQMLLNFTPDHLQAHRTLDVLDQLIDREAVAEAENLGEDPLGLVARDVRSIAAQIGRAAGAPRSAVAEFLADGGLDGGGRNTAIMAEILFEMAAEETAAMREQRRAEIESMAESLQQLAASTAGIEGRKYLVLFSGGFDPYVFQAGGERTMQSLRSAIESFRRSGWMIQSVDSDRPGRSGGGEDDAAGLVLLARETGGEVYRNFNDLSGAMERVLDRSSVTYVLAFQVPEPNRDGGFHELRVRLKDVPRRTRVLHRSGYAARPRDAGGVASELDTAQLLLGDEVREEISTAVLAVPFKSGSGAPRVSVVLQLDGEDLLEGQQESTLSAEVFGYVFSRDGVIAGHFGQAFSIDLKGRREVLADRGLKVFGDLELESGQYSLRLLVRNPLSGRYTTKSAPIDVPSFDDQAQVMRPLFIEGVAGPTVVLKGESVSGEEAAPASYRFRIGDRTYVPVVAPVVIAAPMIRVCVPVYRLDLDHQMLAAELRLADGEVLGRDRLRMVGRDGPDAEGLSQVLLELDAESLAAARYSLEVALVDSRTGASRRASTTFEIVSP